MIPVSSGGSTGSSRSDRLATAASAGPFHQALLATLAAGSAKAASLGGKLAYLDLPGSLVASLICGCDCKEDGLLPGGQHLRYEQPVSAFSTSGRTQRTTHHLVALSGHVCTLLKPSCPHAA